METIETGRPISKALSNQLLDKIEVDDLSILSSKTGVRQDSIVRFILGLRNVNKHNQHVVIKIQEYINRK